MTSMTVIAANGHVGSLSFLFIVNPIITPHEHGMPSKFNCSAITSEYRQASLTYPRL